MSSLPRRINRSIDRSNGGGGVCFYSLFFSRKGNRTCYLQEPNDLMTYFWTGSIASPRFFAMLPAWYLWDKVLSFPPLSAPLVRLAHRLIRPNRARYLTLEFLLLNNLHASRVSPDHRCNLLINYLNQSNGKQKTELVWNCGDFLSSLNLFLHSSHN